MPKQVSYKESSTGWYFKPKAGGYPAIIVWVMELWTESKVYHEGDEPRDVTEIRIIFEIEAEQEIRDSEKEELTWEFEDKIWLIGQNYSEIVTDKSNLWKVIKAVYDVNSIKEIKNFSLDKLLWLKAYIEIDLVGKKKNIEVIKSVSWYSKKIKYHEQVRKNFYFWMEDLNDFDEDLMKDKEVLKPWDIERIENSPEYQKLCKKLWVEIIKPIEEQKEELVSVTEAKKVFNEFATDTVRSKPPIDDDFE